MPLIRSFEGRTPAFSDDGIAAGPSSVIITNNAAITIRTKTGLLVAEISQTAFWNPVAQPNENRGDVRVLFDAGSSRFFISALGRVCATTPCGEIVHPTCTPGTCVSHLFLAVSRTAAPLSLNSSDWYIYAFDATLEGGVPTARWLDFPGLGVTGDAIVVTAHMFPFNEAPSSTNQTIKIRIFDKAKLVVGASMTWTDIVALTDPSDGMPLRNILQPGQHRENSGHFFLVSEPRGACGFVVWAIDTLLASPTVTRQLLRAACQQASAPNVPQPGGGPLIFSIRALHNTVPVRGGSLWITQSVGINSPSGTVSAIRLVQIDVNGWPGTVSFVQDFTLHIDGVWLFQPALAVDASSNVIIVLGRSSPTEFASLAYTGRLAGDPPNTLRPVAPIKLGTATLTLPTGGHAGDAIPYADYFGAAVDPVDGTAWVVGHYVPSATALGTWVGNIGLPLTLTASVNQSTFAVGQTFTASATLADPGLPGSADLFLGVLLPDGANLVFWTGPGTTATGSVTDVRSFRPYAAAMSLETPFVTSMPNFISYQWTGSEPRGPYVFFHLATRAGVLASGTVSAADVIALSTAAFSFP